jgi:hypothetical protein
MRTTYTLHSAKDHSILRTFTSGGAISFIGEVTLLAKEVEDQGTVRIYAHNGVGIIGAALLRNGVPHDADRHDYMRFEPKARALRDAASLD